MGNSRRSWLQGSIYTAHASPLSKSISELPQYGNDSKSVFGRSVIAVAASSRDSAATRWKGEMIRCIQDAALPHHGSTRFLCGGLAAFFSVGFWRPPTTLGENRFKFDSHPLNSLPAHCSLSWSLGPVII